MSTSASVTRRAFVKNAAAGTALAAAAATVAGTAQATEAAADALTFADTVAWDGLYDVVVVGFGGAGAVAAKSAADAGASVLLIDKAPWGEHGGNTRFSGQDFFTCTDADAAKAYYAAMATTFDYDQARIDVFVDGICGNVAWLEENYGPIADLTTFDGEVNEFPMLVEHTGLFETTVSGNHSDAQLWKTLARPLMDGSYDGKVDVWYSSPALDLIQDPATKTVVGVVVEKDGEPVNVRATNGVVMTIGGFENNEAMRQAYLGRTNLLTLGSLYNTGDGIPMVAKCGAAIRNMFNWSGYGNLCGLCWDQPEGHHSKMLLDNNFCEGSMLVAGGDGQRYVNEEVAEFGHATREDKHGRSEHCGEWLHANHPAHNHYIMDQAQYDRLDAAGSITEDVVRYMVSAATVEELCAQCEGLDAEILAQTIDDYNAQVDLGQDFQCKRPIETMEKIDLSTTLYAIPMKVCMMNTQGGPDRNERYEVLDCAGEVIPNLYAAGEFGGIVSNYYQGDGNLSEVLVSGRIAGANAAEAKEALPALTDGRAAVESTVVYAVDADYPRFAAPEFEAGENEYIGTSGNGMGDRLTVKVTMDGDKIASIDLVELQETIGVCDPAVVQVPAAILEAQSVEVDSASGASLTSRAIKEAVADALAQVK